MDVLIFLSNVTVIVARRDIRNIFYVKIKKIHIWIITSINESQIGLKKTLLFFISYRIYNNKTFKMSVFVEIFNGNQLISKF